MDPAEASRLAVGAVDAVNEAAGSHAGFRALHAKGVVCSGHFTPEPAAAGMTRAAFMQAEVPVTVRFSNGSGDPGQPDGKPDGRGLAVKFQLPDGSRTDMVTVTLPCFFVRRVEDFVPFTKAAKPLPRLGIPGPALGLYVLRHREVIPALKGAAAWTKPVPSYANCHFNSIHSFRWTGADDESRWVRFSWLPEAGRKTISAKEAKALGPDHLSDELRRRLDDGPVRFRLQLQLAGPDDPIDDPTQAWPADRDTVEAGTLEIDALDTSRETGDDVLVFDPTRVTNGIDLSDDPILHFRSYAYSESIKRRTGISRPDSLDA
jgi:catalase